MPLPSVLQPAWPVLKRIHRFVALCAGFLTRRMAPLLGSRGGPRGAWLTSAETVVHTGGAALHTAGPGEGRALPAAQGTPPGHWRFRESTHVAIPERYTLELPDGIVVGDYGAVLTADRMLDVQTSDYFGIAGWREHPVFLRPVLPRPEHVPGTLLNLTTRGTSANYYHFLFDALPRYGTYLESGPDRDVDAILVPHATRYQRQFLQLLGIETPLLQPARDRVWQADRLLVPSTPNHALDAPAWSVEWLRATFRPRTESTARRLYITRGDRPNSRRYVQEAEIWPELDRRGFTRIDPGSFTVQEQIDMFHAAEIVVAPHGAGLSNIVFSSPGVRVLELFANDYVHLGLWNITHSLPDCHYRYLVAAGRHRDGHVMAGVLTDVDIPASVVLAEIDDLLA